MEWASQKYDIIAFNCVVLVDVLNLLCSASHFTFPILFYLLFSDLSSSP